MQIKVNQHEFRCLRVARSLQRETADVSGVTLASHGKRAAQRSVRKDSQ